MKNALIHHRADIEVRRNACTGEKAYTDLSEDDVALLSTIAVKPIARHTVNLNPAAWPPPSKPAV